VPFALPEGVVPGRAEVVAECGHAARVEPEDVGVKSFLGDARLGEQATEAA
jgi:hypothetical protein